jgi:hypothetical protein
LHDAGYGRRRWVYRAVAIGLLVWAAALLYIAVAVIRQDLYWFSYYAVDYTFGFVRRGLAGKIVGFFGHGHYFAANFALRWASTVAYLLGLAALMWVVLARTGRSERGIMLALLIPVLPFGYAFALYSVRPDLFGAAALIGYGILLLYLRSSGSTVVCSAIYGVLTAVLSLLHEAIGLEFALGAILGVIVLARDRPRGVQRLCMLLAVGPGFASALVIAAWGRHGIASKLCSQVPHRMIENPLATKRSLPEVRDFLLHGRRVQADYHEWVCRNILPNYDYSIGKAVKIVADIGLSALLTSTVVGVLALAGTAYFIGYFSGVPFSGFVGLLRGRLIWPVVGAAVMLAVFMTGFDWVRWWVIVTFGIAVVYILYASDRPELRREPPVRTVRVFVGVVIAAALLPIGTIPGFGGPQML